MKVAIPQYPKDRLIDQIIGAIKHAFERVKEYAVVPPGGAAGSVLLKVDAREYHSAWSAAPTTGTATASFAATNKPGAANGTPQLWIPIVVGTNTYYIPAFS